MRHCLGLDENEARVHRKEHVLYYEPETLINGHALICGMSGTGKSHISMAMLASAAKSELQIDIFDVHEELNAVLGSVAMKYSQHTRFGVNPLDLDTDIHSGGPMNQINFFVKLLKDVSAGLGVQQESVLRNLLMDTYNAAGIFQNDRRTWERQKITERQRKEIVFARRWGDLRKYYPTIEDLLSYANKKVIALTIGGDNEAVTAYTELATNLKKLQRLNGRYAKSTNDEEIAKLETTIEAGKHKCTESHTAFIQAMKTGKEIEDVLKYKSVDVLSSLISRIELLNSTGIFNANPAPFGDSKVRVHQIKSLTVDQQRLFVKLRLHEIFEKCKQMGITAAGKIRWIIYVDEAHRFFGDDEDDIFGVIARESRKFGLALWCASQGPTEFPESFLTNCGATFVLGLHANYWKKSATMLRLSEEALKTVKPKEVIAVKMQRQGQSDPPFTNIIVPNPSTIFGKRAMTLSLAKAG